jgi:hypothetical protein
VAPRARVSVVKMAPVVGSVLLAARAGGREEGAEPAGISALVAAQLGGNPAASGGRADVGQGQADVGQL